MPVSNPNLLVTATGPDNFQFEANLPFEFNVSLNQLGFPTDVSGELISSAAVVDFDNDGEDEFISAAKSGFVHVFEMDGSEWVDGFGNVFYETGDQNWGSPAVGNSKILTEHDNLPSDQIESKIVDGTSDSFEIQFKTSTQVSSTIGARLCYHVMGDATSVS